jgi:hypothetical protein
MRTTVNLDSDVYEIACLYARGRGMTLSAAICELVRKGFSPASESSGVVIGSHGLPVFRSRGRVLTSEMVKAAQEDDRE